MMNRGEIFASKDATLGKLTKLAVVVSQCIAEEVGMHTAATIHNDVNVTLSGVMDFISLTRDYLAIFANVEDERRLIS